MIKINLIQPVERESELKLDEIRNPNWKNALYALVSLVVCLGLVGLLYAGWNHQISELNGKIAAARIEAARLMAVEAQNHRYQADLTAISNHIMVIQSLEKTRTGPRDLMTKLGNSVSRINGLYLLSVQSNSNQLVIDGEAGHVHAIADFIAALESDTSFQNVDLRQVFEDDQNNTVNFKFDLVCLYSPPVELAASIPPAAPTGGSVRPPGR